jgi:hypothetical protein
LYGMNTQYRILLIVASFFLGGFLYVSAQDGPTLTATLDSYSPLAQSLQTGAQYVDVARITLTASNGDVYLSGIYMGTDVSDGLSNFTNMYLYDTYDSSLVGTYPTQSENPNLIQFTNPTYVRIGLGQSKTYLVRASLASSATGDVRVGFSGFTFSTQALPTLVGVPIYGNVMTLPGTVATPTPSPSPTPTLTPSPTPTPTPSSIPTPVSLGFTNLADLGLKEGDTISAASLGDPDIYIANAFGYRRLFLNPIIFSFYGHLGGFKNVKPINAVVKQKLVTSGLFRNCETNLAGQSDQKVYGVEINGEDTGILHWINTTGAQAVTDDPDFFKKVFCINTNEFNWYPKGSDYTSVTQVPNYSR